MEKTFRSFAQRVSEIVGSPIAFIIAVMIIIVWAISGTFFNHSDTWQLVINTSTTIVTFLIVFLIQNTQNRESKAINLKLDELILSVKTARNKMINVEELTDMELQALEEKFRKLANRKQNN